MQKIYFLLKIIIIYLFFISSGFTSKSSYLDEGKVLFEKKVIRGGSWFAPAQSITTTHRFWNNPMNNSYGVGLGFRCARSLSEDLQTEARSFYMNALILVGDEKYKKALLSIKNALINSPKNKEYKALKLLIQKQLNP